MLDVNQLSEDSLSLSYLSINHQSINPIQSIHLSIYEYVCIYVAIHLSIYLILSYNTASDQKLAMVRK